MLSTLSPLLLLSIRLRPSSSDDWVATEVPSECVELVKSRGISMLFFLFPLTQVNFMKPEPHQTSLFRIYQVALTVREWHQPTLSDEWVCRSHEVAYQISDERLRVQAMQQKKLTISSSPWPLPTLITVHSTPRIYSYS